MRVTLLKRIAVICRPGCHFHDVSCRVWDMTDGLSNFY